MMSDFIIENENEAYQGPLFAMYHATIKDSRYRIGFLYYQVIFRFVTSSFVKQ